MHLKRPCAIAGHLVSLVLLVPLVPLGTPLLRAGANGRWMLAKRRPHCPLLAAQGKVRLLATRGGRHVQRGLPAPRACAGGISGTVRGQNLTTDHVCPPAQRLRRRLLRSVERHGSLCGGRCAARRGARRDLLCGGQHAAPHGAQRELRCGGRLRTPDAAHGLGGGGASLAAAASDDGSNPSAAVGGPGIWGFPSDWPATPDSRPDRRRRARVRVPRADIRCVRGGAGAHLQDASEIVMEEWEAVEPSTIAHCGVKAPVLPHALTTEVTSLHGEYRASSRELGDDVNAVVSLLGDCRFGQEAFIDTPTPVREMAVQDWLSMEDDEGVLAATADKINIYYVLYVIIKNIVEGAGCNDKEVEGGGGEEREDSSDSDASSASVTSYGSERSEESEESDEIGENEDPSDLEEEYCCFFFRHSRSPRSRMAGREGKGRMEGRRVEVPVSCQVNWSTARVCRHGCVLAAAQTTRARLDIKSNAYCGLCSCDRPKTVRQPGRKIWRLTNQRGSDRPRSQSERERSGLCAVRMHRWTGAVMCAGVSYSRILTVHSTNEGYSHARLAQLVPMVV